MRRSQRIRDRPTPTPIPSDFDSDSEDDLWYEFYSQDSPIIAPNTTMTRRYPQRQCQRQHQRQVDPSVVAADAGVPSIDSSLRKPLKRKIKEEPDDSVEFPPAKAQETYIKHPDHWALDGNVLLQFGNTRFSVHRSRLAIQSSYFEALFAARSNLPFESEDSEKIEYIVNHAEVVNGLDLFYFDYDDAPNAEEFATLLTAMDNAIQYAHNKPKLDVLRNILVAAHYYRFNHFINFAKESITVPFPENVLDITSIKIPNSIEVIKLARAYDIFPVLPAAFYQLARTKPSVDRNKLEQLNPKDLIMISDLQKQNVVLWDVIFDIVGHKCQVAKCVIFHTQHVHTVKKKYPWDPIIGMKKLIKYDWSAAKDYCPTASKEVVNKLSEERLKFWNSLKARLNSDGSDSD